jgi:L-alanine-DL-glutamate epimerase-like enolase superfamily enzyme
MRGVGRMKIVDVVAHLLSTPLEEPFAFSQGRVRRRSAVVVEVVTDEGVTGWGESLYHRLQSPEGLSATADGYLSLETTGSDKDPYGSRQGHHPGRSLALLRLRQLGGAPVAREADVGQYASFASAQ